MLRIGIDSCAAASVLPLDSCPDFRLRRDSESGTRYRTAGGGILTDQGARVVLGRLGQSSVLRAARFRVAPVKRALMSVADLVDKRYRVTFGRGSAGIDTSHLVDEKYGEVGPLHSGSYSSSSAASSSTGLGHWRS